MILWVYPPLEAQAKPLQEHIVYNYSDTVAYGLPTPPTEAARAITMRYDAPKYVIGHRYRTNCVETVRRAGFYVPRTLDGRAITMPVTSTKLPPEGIKVVAKTSESYMGHVVVLVNNGGKLTTVVDSVGIGRDIPLSLYRGYVAP